MKYLEIINEYEKSLKDMEKDGFKFPEQDPTKFLVRAFNVMRQIAINSTAGCCETNLTYIEAAESIDEEFEERMKNNC